MFDINPDVIVRAFIWYVAFLFSTTCHEAAHALAAKLQGDETAARELARRDVERARNFAAAQNHDAIPDDGRSHEPLSSIAAPTLVIHGAADPVFPLEHGEAAGLER